MTNPRPLRAAHCPAGRTTAEQVQLKEVQPWQCARLATGLARHKTHVCFYVGLARLVNDQAAVSELLFEAQESS